MVGGSDDQSTEAENQRSMASGDLRIVTIEVLTKNATGYPSSNDYVAGVRGRDNGAIASASLERGTDDLSNTSSTHASMFHHHEQSINAVVLGRSYTTLQLVEFAACL